MYLKSIDPFIDQNVINSPDFHLSRILGIDNYKDYYICQLNQYIEKTNVFTIKNINGLATLEYLDWDTKLLGFKSARMVYFLPNSSVNNSHQNLVEDIINLAKEKNIEYITTRLSTNDLKSIQTLETNGFLTTDNIITFSLNLDNSPEIQLNKADYECILYDRIEPIINEAIPEIAKDAFKNDRFHNDPLIPLNKADNIYFEWMKNTVNNINELLFIAIDSNKAPLGFISVKNLEIMNLDVSTIVLVAVDEKLQGKNIGFNLLNKTIEGLKEQKVNIVNVGTQISNIPAQRLYLKAGFKPVCTSTTLRKYIVDCC